MRLLNRTVEIVICICVAFSIGYFYGLHELGIFNAMFIGLIFGIFSLILTKYFLLNIFYIKRYLFKKEG